MENRFLAEEAEAPLSEEIAVRADGGDAARRGRKFRFADVFSVGFDDKQKKFFGVVRGIFLALISIVLFALAFTDVYSVDVGGIDVGSTDMIAMMFDTAYEWDEETDGELAEYELASIMRDMRDAQKKGDFLRAKELYDDYMIYSSRIAIRASDDNGAYGPLITRGVIAFFMVIFAFISMAFYIFVSVRSLAGRERLPARFKKAGALPVGVPMAGYLFYLLLMLLACTPNALAGGAVVCGSFAAALALASLGTVISVADAVHNKLSSCAEVSERKAARKRAAEGLVVAATALVTVGIMFCPDVVTLRSEEYKGATDLSFFTSFAMSESTWEMYCEKYIDISDSEKREIIGGILGSDTALSSDTVASKLHSTVIAYDYDNEARHLTSGYYVVLLAAALIGAAGAAAFASIANDKARSARRILMCAGILAIAVFVAVCGVVAGVFNATYEWLELPLDGENVPVYTAGVGACGIVAFVVALIGAITAEFVRRGRNEQNAAEDDLTSPYGAKEGAGESGEDGDAIVSEPGDVGEEQEAPQEDISKTWS